MRHLKTIAFLILTFATYFFAHSCGSKKKELSSTVTISLTSDTGAEIGTTATTGSTLKILFKVSATGLTSEDLASANVYYTIDGTDPTTFSGNIVDLNVGANTATDSGIALTSTNPIQITTTTTLKYFAIVRAKTETKGNGITQKTKENEQEFSSDIASTLITFGSTSSTTSVSNPTAVSSSLLSPSQITLTWTRPSGITSTQIAYRTGTTAPTDCQSNTTISSATIGSASTYTVTSLAANTTYTFLVCSVSGSNYSSGVSTSTTIPDYHYVFVTTSTYSGSGVGGLAGADSKCSADATAAGLSGTWKAALCDTSTAASSRLTFTKQIVNKRPMASGGPQVVATSGSTLWSGGISNSVNYTASGGTPSATYVWTGCDLNGVNTGVSCTNWSSTASTVNCGGASQTSSNYWMAYIVQNCSSSFGIYCVSQ